MMKIAAGAVAALIAIPLFAQQPQTAPPPLTERVEVSIVNVDVTVLDSKGQPVRGLTADDFEVFEDKKPQKITNFSEFGLHTPASNTPSNEARLATQSADETSPLRRKVLVMVDNAGSGRAIKMLEAIQRFLEPHFDEGDEWSVVSYGRLSKTLQPFTSDRAAIIAALKRAFGAGPPSGPRSTSGAEAGRLSASRDIGSPSFSAADVRRDGTSVVEAGTAINVMAHSGLPVAVLHAIHAMASMPGRKSILLVTSYVPGYERPGEAMFASRIDNFLQDDTTLPQLHAAMVRAANAASVNIFVLDPMGVGGDFEHANRRTSGSYWLSRETGGSYLRSNRLSESFAEFQASTTNYYELGYRAATADDKYHHIDVRLKRPGRYNIQHRDGYVRLSPERAFEQTLVTPLGIAELKPTLPLTLAIGSLVAESSGHTTVPIQTSVPVDALTFLNRREGRTGRIHLYITAFDKRSNPVLVQHFIATIAPDEAAKYQAVTMEHPISLAKGTYRVYATIRDELTNDVGIAWKDVSF